jgi:hypothetical protein
MMNPPRIGPDTERDLEVGLDDFLPDHRGNIRIETVIAGGLGAVPATAVLSDTSPAIIRIVVVTVGSPRQFM